MKGFYIEITNNLLEPKHIKAMGSAVWEYMWCLDKITKIDSDGIGWIMGGKPIKRKEVQVDLGKDVSYVSKNLHKLQCAGYINLKRTPYGNIITVNKAKKRYGQKAMSGCDDRATSRKDYRATSQCKKATSSVQKGNIYIDKAVRQGNRQDSIVISNEITNKINPLIELFKEVNPTYKRLYPNITQRNALERLIEDFGTKKVEWAIKILPQTNGMDFAPIITNPIELEQKLGKLIAFTKRESNKLKPSYSKIR